MMSPESAASKELVTRVRAVDGVTDIFTPRPAITQIPGLLAAATGVSPDGPATEILITDQDGVAAVAARIATSLQDNTVDTARRVADTLLANTPVETQVTLQIARIH